ncbi:HAD family hydrolase [Catenulispora subtropica]|uniref:HAD family hydrolase n=1 Tax=Catenulispora subtropica TaxID=450798 RepID=A0ABN2SHZ8_9ACTN
MTSSAKAGTAALLDLDGTLVDTNYQHAIAWYRAFRDHGVVLPVWRLHRHIGMGGGQLVAAVAGERVEHGLGDDVRDAHSRHFRDLLDEAELMPDARRLIEVLHERGDAVVLASSASEENLKHFRSMLDADDLLAGATSSADVEQAKPEPDIICAALEKVPDAERSVLIGDSTWDCIAARRAGVASVALLTGGFSEQELRDAGAAAVFESIAALLEQLDRTPLG